MISGKLPTKWLILLLTFIGTICIVCLLWVVPTIPEINSGDPVPREGTLTNGAITPNLTDKEYYELALNIAEKNGWNADDISLRSLGRKFSCGAPDSSLTIAFTLFRWRRIGLRWAADIGYIDLSPYSHEAAFYLSESQGSVSNSLFHEAGLELDKLQIDSREAVSLVNKEAKGIPPAIWNGECNIGVINNKESEQPIWEVSYASKASDEVFRARVNAISGEVIWDK